jgi:hypothetical protein
LPHKKALTINGIAQYHYIVEDSKQDFNYNGILNERYFLRTSPKGGQAGAGLIYILDKLIDSGMKPTAVVLEGITWYNMARDGAQWATLKKYIDYLDAKGIKAIAYTALGHITGQAMSTSFKDEYILTADIYAYDEENGIGKKKWGNLDEELEDDYRIEYMREHLRSLSRAYKAGAPVRGYFHWSIMDTNELYAGGYNFIFGLTQINYETLERRPRKSWYYYQQVIKDGFVI